MVFVACLSGESDQIVEHAARATNGMMQYAA